MLSILGDSRFLSKNPNRQYSCYFALNKSHFIIIIIGIIKQIFSPFYTTICQSKFFEKLYLDSKKLGPNL